MFFAVCGGELSAPYGSISSPGYPGNYPPNRDCFWTVSVQPGLLITFAFGTLKLEDHPSCNYDFLEVILQRIFNNNPSLLGYLDIDKYGMG